MATLHEKTFSTEATQSKDGIRLLVILKLPSATVCMSVCSILPCVKVFIKCIVIEKIPELVLNPLLGQQSQNIRSVGERLGKREAFDNNSFPEPPLGNADSRVLHKSCLSFSFLQQIYL